MALTIISLMKQVPLPSEMRMGDDGLMDRTKAKSIINIDCQYGLEAGLQLKYQNKDAKLIVCSMGPPSFTESLTKAIAFSPLKPASFSRITAASCTFASDFNSSSS